jgi:hypothetical protein
MSALGWDDLGNVVPIRGFDKEALKREVPLEYVLYRAGVDLMPDTSGSRLVGMCPFGQHTGPKFAIWETESGERVCGCWACPDKTHADLFGLLQWLAGPDSTFSSAVQQAVGLKENLLADAAWQSRPAVVLAPVPKTDPAVFTADAEVALQTAYADPSLINTLIERKRQTDPGWNRVTPNHLMASWRVGAEPEARLTRGVSNPDATPYDRTVIVRPGTRVIVPHYALSDDGSQWIVRGIKTRDARHGHLFAAAGSDLARSLYGAWRSRGMDWVLLCEGESDAWCASAVPDISTRMDVFALPTGVKANPHPEQIALLRGKNVVLAFDGDLDGQRGFGKWVSALEGFAASIWVVRVPADQDLAGVDDLLAVVQSMYEVGHQETGTLPADGESSGAAAGRPELFLGEEQDTVRWLWDELGTNGLSGMFLRGDQLVHTAAVGEEGYKEPEDSRDSDGPYQVRQINHTGLAARITDAYEIVKFKTDRTRMRPVFPKGLAEMAISYLDRAPNLRTIRGVTHVPMPRKDGSLITTPGFDRESGYLYLPTLEVPVIPADVSGEKIKWATDFLEFIVKEFRWAGEHDKANFFGMLLTPLMRLLTPPPYKLGIIGAHQPGSGKSLLSSIITTVHGGVFRAEMPTDGVELEKLLLGILLTTTAPVVLFDNLSGVVRSSHLAGLLTSADYSSRILGSSANASVPNNRLWLGNGNNVSLGGDMARRVLWSMIDPGVPDPHLQTFRLNIPEFLRARRGDVLRALLIWIQHWRQLGGVVTPVAGDSYTVWINTTREILSAAGVSGTFDHRDSIRQMSGVDDDGWSEFLRFVHSVTQGQSFTVKELLSWCEQDLMRTNPLYDGLLEVMPDELAKRVGHSGKLAIIAKSLGKWLSNRDGRWANGLTVKHVGERQHVKLWATSEYSS